MASIAIAGFAPSITLVVFVCVIATMSFVSVLALYFRHMPTQPATEVVQVKTQPMEMTQMTTTVTD